MLDKIQVLESEVEKRTPLQAMVSVNNKDGAKYINIIKC
jgi:hypothetical protein